MGWLDKYEDGGKFNGLTDKGFNYNGAWGGQFQTGGSMKDMYGSPIISNSRIDPEEERAYYDPRINRVTYDKNYLTMSPEDRHKLQAHENFHAYQFANDRTNFDIVHKPEEAFQSLLQKKPQMMTTNQVYDQYHNRKQKETEEDVKNFRKYNKGFDFVPDQAIYTAVVDQAQYENPYSIEGEAEHYQNTGEYPTFQTGGSMPGSVGFTYARTGAPSNGKYAKKTLASAQSGEIIDDDMGQWAHPGEITRINSNNITMQGVNQDLLGVSNTGDKKLMKPGKNYKFKGSKVTEYPVSKDGNQLTKLNQLTNFTNYNTKQPGGWLDTL